jgi:hypothetical protein
MQYLYYSLYKMLYTMENVRRKIFECYEVISRQITFSYKLVASVLISATVNLYSTAPFA